MKKRTLALTFISLLIAGTGTAMACEYKAGETEFLDYANCRYDSESLIVVEIPENSSWDKCVYLIEAFRPAKLLAVTRVRDGKEQHSINSRGNIGNPCYLTKKSCDAALKAYMAEQN